MHQVVHEDPEDNVQEEDEFNLSAIALYVYMCVHQQAICKPYSIGECDYKDSPT